MSRPSAQQSTGDSPPFDLKTELKHLPTSPGVYRMYDAEGTLIYIGKAKVLKNRVRSYFQAHANHTPKVKAMVQHIARFNTICTTTEIEALILEDSLIKQHKPKYNILLRDDRRFPWIGVSDDAYPRLFVTRSPKRLNGKRTRYYGPFTQGRELYDILDVLKRHFPLRQRPTPLYKDKLCMNYHIGVCSGPCQQKITPEAYRHILEQAIQVLKGQTHALEQRLLTHMQQASENLQFELAASLRDRLKAVQQLGQKQHIVSDDNQLQVDAITYATDEFLIALNVLVIRYGKVVASKPFTLTLNEASTPAEALNAFILQYYREVEADALPDDVLLPTPIEDAELVADWLSAVRGKRVMVSIPQKGHKHELLNLSILNASTTLEQRQLYEATRTKNDPMRALHRLAEVLHLPSPPKRIECYDISHFQGAYTVASMVVFINGVPAKEAYRSFNIRLAEGKPDDFLSHYEAMQRRLTHAHDWGLPDLFIIDGGKGQLSSAQKALQEAGLGHLPMVSLAKRYEEIFLPNQSQPVVLRHDDPTLFLVQQLRDEAHRLGITKHRQRRDKAALASPLDTIAGLGDVRKSKLLQQFKHWQAISQASPQEVQACLGCSPALAHTLWERIQQKR
ncbi:MAG: excinuclease ABC subunit UvrC [Vampirovibrionales bacterium]